MDSYKEWVFNWRLFNKVMLFFFFLLLNRFFLERQRQKLYLLLKECFSAHFSNCARWSHLGDGLLGSVEIVCQALAQPFAFGYMSERFSIKSAFVLIFSCFASCVKTGMLENQIFMTLYNYICIFASLPPFFAWKQKGDLKWLSSIWELIKNSFSMQHLE